MSEDEENSRDFVVIFVNWATREQQYQLQKKKKKKMQKMSK